MSDVTMEQPAAAAGGGGGDGEGESCCVQVAVRVRGLNPDEVLAGAQPCLTVIPEEKQVIPNMSDSGFRYDHVFDDHASQQHIFDLAVQPLVAHFVNGYNVTVLAYGQTGSGKTYTMGSNFAVGESDESVGMIPRVIMALFSLIEARREAVSVTVSASFLEIYNEQINDLLGGRENLAKIYSDEHGNIRVGELERRSVASLEALEEFLRLGAAQRSTAATKMNAVSSRSHAIFTIVLEQTGRAPGPDGAAPVTTVSEFHLVDLAGSERAKKTGAEGERLREASNINKSLSTLGQVIEALAKGKTHVPYRDSKLTHLLSNSLGGNARTLMIACASPADVNFDETMSTLKYAVRAGMIQNRPVINLDHTSAENARLRKKVQDLMTLVQELQACGAKTNAGGGRGSGGGVGAWAAGASSRGGAAGAAVDPARYLAALERYRALLEEHSDTTAQVESLLAAIAVGGEAPAVAAAAVAAARAAATGAATAREAAARAGADAAAGAPRHSSASRALSGGGGDGGMHTRIGGVELPADAEAEDAAVEAAAALEKHVEKTSGLRDELESLRACLRQKEVQLQATTATSSQLDGAAGAEQDESVEALHAEIERLSAERAALAERLRAEAERRGGAAEAAEGDSRARTRLLEAQIERLKRALAESERTAKSRASAKEAMERLQAEVTAMKTAKIRLEKRIKEENARFKEEKAAREREMAGLQRRSEKSALALSKVSEELAKTKAVLKVTKAEKTQSQAELLRMKQKRSDVIASKSAYARRARAAAITAGNSRRRAPSCGVEDAAAGGPDGAGYYDDVDDLERGAAELVQAAARAIGRPVGGDAGGAGGGGDLGIVNCDTLGVLPADAELPALAAGVLREVAALRVRHATLALEEAELQKRRKDVAMELHMRIMWQSAEEDLAPLRQALSQLTLAIRAAQSSLLAVAASERGDVEVEGRILRLDGWHEALEGLGTGGGGNDVKLVVSWLLASLAQATARSIVFKTQGDDARKTVRALKATVENAESERAALGYRLEAAAAAAQAETEGRASAALFMRAAGDADGLSAAREEELAKLRAQADRLVEAESERIKLAGRVAELEARASKLSEEAARAQALAPPPPPPAALPVPPTFDDDKRAIAGGPSRRDRSGSAPQPELTRAVSAPELGATTTAAAGGGGGGSTMAMIDTAEIETGLAAFAGIAASAPLSFSHYQQPTLSYKAKVAPPKEAEDEGEVFAPLPGGDRFLDPTNTQEHENRISARRVSVRGARGPLAPASYSGAGAARRMSLAGVGRMPVGCTPPVAPGRASAGAAPPPLPPPRPTKRVRMDASIPDEATPAAQQQLPKKPRVW